MLSFEKDPDSPRYLWLGGHDTVTPEDINTLVECYKETGYTVRCNHKKGHQDPIQARFLGNHIWYMTKDDMNWLMLAYHYGRSQWFVESFVAEHLPQRVQQGPQRDLIEGSESWWLPPACNSHLVE